MFALSSTPSSSNTSAIALSPSVARHPPARQLLRDPTPRLAGPHGLRARELPRIARVIEQPRASEPLDGGVDVGGRLALPDQRSPQLDHAPSARLEQVERAVVRRSISAARAAWVGIARSIHLRRKNAGESPLVSKGVSGSHRRKRFLPDSIVAAEERETYSSVTSISLITSRGPTPSSTFTFSSTSAMSAGESRR